MTEISERNGGYGGPDPTTLTSQLVMRELTSLRELLESRLDGMDKAQTLFHDGLTQIPTQTDRAVGNLKELHEKMFAEKFGTIDERFHGIELQFKERDERVKQTALDTKTAVDAALAAQEKAVSKQNDSNAEATNKAETQFTRLIEQQRLALDGVMKSLNEKIDDVKDLVLRGEGRQTGTSSSLGIIFAVIGALGVITGIVLALRH